MNNKAFTLVELIVVITILAILATLWFISFQWYVVSSRDTVRVSDIKSIEKSLWLYALKESTFLEPVESVTFTSSWVSMSQQWILDEETLWKLGVFWNLNDPLTEEFYRYAINPQKNKYQILGLFEQNNVSVFSQSYASTDKYPRLFWDEVGFIFESDNPFVTPENNIDIFDESNQLDIMVNNDSISYDVTWSGIIKKLSPVLNHMRSCKTLYDLWNVRSTGLYKIVSQDGNIQEEFCEMEVKSGGWSLLAAAPADSVDFWNRYDDGIWKNPSYDFSVIDWYHDQEYLSKSYESLATNEIMLCQENNTMCFVFPHKKNIPLYNFFRDNIRYKMVSYNMQRNNDIWKISTIDAYMKTFQTSNYIDFGLWDCWVLGINLWTDTSATTQLFGYGWDNDAPCIEWTRLGNGLGLVDWFLDNYGLWLGMFFRNTWYKRQSDYVETPDLAWYQKYNILWKYRDIWDDMKSWPAIFMSDTWYVFGK